MSSIKLSEFNSYDNDEVTITKIRKTHWFLRSVSLFTVTIFLGSMVVPQFLYAQTAHDIKARQLASENESKNITESLKDFRKLTQVKKQKVDKYLDEEGRLVEEVMAFFGFSQLTMEEVEGFKELRTRLKKHHQAQLKEFSETRQWIDKKSLGEEMHKRHQAMIDDHNEKYQELENYFAMLFDSEDIIDQSTALDKLNVYANALKLERSHEFTDPNQLPWGMRDTTKARAPYDVKSYQHQKQQAKAKLQAQLETEANEKLSTLEKGAMAVESALISSAHADNSAPEDYLAETIEVKFTADIVAKAAELNNDPVKIYNWVRNNVESIPTFGSIQGADMTLATQRGNPFDIASLLVALLRSSGTPARFAIGSVSIDSDRAINWVGNAGTPQAALNLLAQGGTPIRGLTRGGKIAELDMEHIWVEAFVDYEPSRGFHNVTPDTWIPMDASFKQYDYTQGYNLEQAVPFDAQGLIDDITASATIDETAGTIQNIDQAAIETAFANYQTEIETYINNQDPDATVGEVLGTKKAIIHEPNQLASGLPYRVNLKLDDYADIPDSYRHKWQVQIQSKDRYGYGSTLIEITKNLAEINDKTLAIHFDPATQQDEDVITSLLPEPDENGDIDPNDLPTSLPASLINMTASIAIDEQNASTSSPMKVGTELNLRQGLFDPVYGWSHTDSTLIAGEYVALGVNGSSINPKLLSKVQTELEQAKTELETIQTQTENNEEPTITDFLTKHTLTGNILQTTILSYFALNNLQDQLASQSSEYVMNTNLPSFGTFSSKLNPHYGFGGLVISKVDFSGVGMDVDYYYWATTSTRNQSQDVIAFHRGAGSRLSAMEHIVPEEVFKDEDNPANSPQGISAVKALAIAAQQGQKIYTITQANANQIQNINADAQIIQEITQAVNQGKEVTIHESSISVFGWSGFGYFIIEPLNGTGAYKISGGRNGSSMDLEKQITGFFGIEHYTSAEKESHRNILANSVDVINYSIFFISALTVCYADEIVSISIIALGLLALYYSRIFAIGAAAFTPESIIASLLVMGTGAASASTGEKKCEVDCTKATQFHLDSAEIEDAHAFKDEYFAIPNSRFEICACRDGSIVIHETGKCGRSEGWFSFTHARWK